MRRCPTGALHHDAAPGVNAETPDAPTVIEPRENGPLFARGDLLIRTAGGDVRDTRAALCRCGRSSRKPFCDGTHARTGWRSDAPDQSAEPPNG